MFHLSIRSITFGCYSGYLAYLMRKVCRKTATAFTFCRAVPLYGIIGTVIKLLASDPICFGCFPARARIAKQMVLPPSGRKAA